MAVCASISNGALWVVPLKRNWVPELVELAGGRLSSLLRQIDACLANEALVSGAFRHHFGQRSDAAPGYATSAFVDAP